MGGSEELRRGQQEGSFWGWGLTSTYGVFLEAQRMKWLRKQYADEYK